MSLFLRAGPRRWFAGHRLGPGPDFRSRRLPWRLELLVLDSWNHAGFVENVFYTEPFKQVLFAENFTAVQTAAPPNPTHTFRVKAPQLKANQTLCLLGEGAALGQWNTQTPVLLGRQPEDDYFSVSLDLRGQPFPLAYKYRRV